MNHQTFAPAPAVTAAATESHYDAYVMKNYARAAVTLVRGEGLRVWDDRGNEYLDFTSGIGVTALGHSHPAWVKAVQDQAARLVHVSNLFRNPQQGELARRIVKHAGPGRAFFCNSGAEANEALIKLSRLHGYNTTHEEGKRFKVLVAKNAFHGRTFGSMSATPQEKIQKGFRPMVETFVAGEFNNLQSFVDLADDSTAAILIETIQGESGVTPATPEFLVGLRKLCDERGLLLLIDEVQCGLGRTGSFYAFQQYGIQADAVSMAKGLGGGMPIGAIWVREPFAEYFQPGSHGTTFGGTPLASAAALAVLDVIERDDLMGNVRRNSPAWHAALEQLVKDFPQVLKEVRGVGYMVGLGFHADPAPINAKLREAGMLCPLAGNNTVRFLPPLTATPADLAKSVEIVRGVLAAA
ncbi:MAG TPA: aspartate aminotransferase family protein [Opitutaceae bacterium]|nr:aspartate aminotransferase family protein [Opitutaceae bacterium]